MSTYTLPRLTRDFDFIVHLTQQDVPLLLNHFKEGYYCDEDAVQDAIRNKGMFNIIDHKSNYKADIVILKNEPFRQEEFARRKEIDLMDMRVSIVSPEDLLISKLIWIQELQSAVQIEDIKSIWKTVTLDRDYIKKWIKTLKLNTFDTLND